MSAEAVTAYQDALREMLQADAHMKATMKQILQLAEYRETWRTLAVVNNNSLGVKEGGGVKAKFSLSGWPDAAAIADAVRRLDAALAAAESAFQKVPPERRIGLLAPQQVLTPPTP